VISHDDGANAGSPSGASSGDRAGPGDGVNTMPASPALDSGILPVDKPTGMTSFDVIRRLRPLLPGARLGHTGTLDPAASGLLLVCIGAATRLVPFFLEMPKTYQAEVLLGTATESDDLDGRVLSVQSVPDITDDELSAVYARFTGIISQRPPVFSALKVGGVRAYTLARRGAPPELRERQVTVYAIAQLAREGERLRLEVRCSSGTYIRSLARDIGAALGCGACLAALRRIHIGDFSAEGAYPGAGGDLALLQAKRLDLAVCLGRERLLAITEPEAERAAHGLIAHSLEERLQGHRADLAALLHPSGRIVAVLRREQSAWRFVCTQAFTAGGE